MIGATRFEVYRAPAIGLIALLRGGGDWRWRFCRGDGGVIATSAGYRSQADCHAAIDALRRRASVAMIVDTDMAKPDPEPINSGVLLSGT